MNLELAELSRAEEICNLVNIAYRGDVGWTKETDIVEGDRTTILEIKAEIQKDNSFLLIALQDNEVISCVCLEKEDDQVYIGLFSVHPDLQGKGVGKNILLEAEEYAFSTLQVSKLVMVVVSQRVELISYYERRGYIKTGRVEEYPKHLNVGVPKSEGLTIEYLEKKSFLLTGYKTIKYSLWTTLPIIILTIAIPIIALCAPDLMPEKETIGSWFQRSGSIVVALAVWIEIKNESISGYIHPTGLVSSEYGEFKKKYGSCFNSIKLIGFSFAILGTIIWGYGDIPFNSA